MVRFGPLALAAALLATPVLGIEGSTPPVGTTASVPADRSTDEVASTAKVGVVEAIKADAVRPRCGRTVRVVYSGMSNHNDPCRIVP